MVYDPYPFLLHVHVNVFSNPRGVDDILNTELPSSAWAILMTA